MTRSSEKALRWLTLAVLLPLLVLGLLAWLGTRAQVRAAWSAARDEAKAAAEVAGEVLSRELTAAVETAPLFPDPPQPAGASAGDPVLDGKDPAALRAVRDDPAAGLSPAGLPRRVLAGFRVFDLSGEADDARALVTIATGDAPSVLTRLALEKTGNLSGDWPARWARGDEARAIGGKYFERIGGGTWIRDNGRDWWLVADGGSFRFIDPASLEKALSDAGRLLPAWADLRLFQQERVLADESVPGEVMEDLPVRFSDGLHLQIIASRPELFEAAARQQARWTLGLLGFAVMISAGGLWMIHRLVERERRLNAMKSDFVASVSHELRAPVASIRLMADALTAGKIEPHTVRDFHVLISREGARLSTLIENVLDFARIEQGRKQWHFEDADLAALVVETVDLMEPLAAEKSMRLVVAEPVSPLLVKVDPGAIRQALVNLLDNAIKFSPRGSTVEIRLQREGEAWQISVSDDGPGIPPEEHERIFERFHRLGSELRRETQGTGIGLSLVKAVAEAHGGKVLLASSVGKGSVFTLTGPVSPVQHP